MILITSHDIIWAVDWLLTSLIYKVYKLPSFLLVRYSLHDLTTYTVVNKHLLKWINNCLFYFLWGSFSMLRWSIYDFIAPTKNNNGWGCSPRWILLFLIVAIKSWIIRNLHATIHYCFIIFIQKKQTVNFLNILPITIKAIVVILLRDEHSHNS